MNRSLLGIRGLVPRFRRRSLAVPADMYLRIDRTEDLLQAFKSIQQNTKFAPSVCALMSAAPPPRIQADLEERTGLYKKSIGRVAASAGDGSQIAANIMLAGSFEVQRRSLALFRLLRPHAAKGFRKARFGSANDGEYILLGDFG